MDANEKINKMVIIFLLSFSLLINEVIAVNVSVRRECPKSASVGSIIQINITVENYEDEEKNITIKELAGNFEPIEPKPIVPSLEKGFAAPAYYQWNLSLPGKSKKTVWYRGRVNKLQDIILSPTTVYVDKKVIYTPTDVIKVLCNQNKICEVNLGENYFTCPQDCHSGSADGVCDLIKDGICDPDCEPSADPDCMFKSKPVCGNMKCEPPEENQTTCCKDCGCPLNLKCIENKCLPCGNGKCDFNLGENYRLCPQDCPSGSKDGICDGVADGRCDPDCKAGEDPDCFKPNYWMFATIVGIALTAPLLYYMRKKPSS